MAAGGLPISTDESVRNTVLAAIALQEYVEQHYRERISTGLPAFQMRVGLDHGSVVAGIVGFQNFQYDIWGDTVNLANRMEKAGVAGRVNISESVYQRIANDPLFRFEARGPVEVKGKGPVEMWFVEKKV
jgi:class 3 adenylate cyclase